MVWRKLRAVAIFAAAVLMASPGFAQQSGQDLRAFASPELAVKALIEAIQAPTLKPLEEILGRGVLESIPPEERRSDTVRRAAGDRLAAEPVEIVYDDEAHTRAQAIIGNEGFRLPTPLIRTTGGWVFDGEAGIAEMRERRIGTNEANAIRALHAFARAEEVYRQRDREGNGILEYAMRIRGTDGHLDGLVNPEGDSVPGPTTSLLNEAFARAEGLPGDQTPAGAGGGYGYRVLTAQGASAQGGARSYLVNGHMTEGFAIVAWPTRPGVTGLSTFIMNNRGTIFEQEFGDGTFEAVRQMTEFNPGPGWAEADE